MKRKGLWIILTLLCAVFLLSFSVSAEEMDEEIRDYIGIDKLYEAIPDGIDQNEIKNLLEEKNTGSLFQKVSEALIRLVSLGIKDGFSFFIGLLAIILLGAIFSAFKNAFPAQQIQSAFHFLFLLILACFSYSSIRNSFETAALSLKMLHSFMTATLPIATLMLSMSGAVKTAAIQKSHLNFVITGASYFTSHSLLPILRGLFSITLIRHFAAIELDGLFRFLKKAIRIFCIFIFTVLSAFLSLQHALASAGDSLGMRSLRFAAGNFIPVVGSLVGEASRTLSAGLKLVRTECGILCLCIILFLILRPILLISIQKIFLSFAASVAEIIGETASKSFLQSLSGILDLLIALLISEGIYFVFYIVLFLNAKGSGL